MDADSADAFSGFNLYGYVPTLGVCVMYVLLFGASFALHCYQTVKSRYWFLAATVLPAGVLEIVGWAGRLASSRDITPRNPYIIQSTVLVLAPTFLLAAHFIVFGRIVTLLGTDYSRLRPKFYTIIFLGGDIISLFTQGAGGGLAATAKDDSKLGVNLLLVGIGIQVVMIGAFSILAVEYTVRHIRDRPHKSANSNSERAPLDAPRKTLLLTLATTTSLLFIRGIYRLIELSGGLDSPIAKTEWPFIVFEGATIFLVFAIWNIGHPAKYLEGRPPRSEGYNDVMLAEAGGPKTHY
ncbi:Envelope glycoprotein gp160 [Marasmius sp. AFHP31]|nr:Envelope glycoprotein gp160 [Marasmius sp. AFHP31]